MQPTPTRTFSVYLDSDFKAPEGKSRARIDIEAHQPHIGPEGSLTLLRYDDLNHIPWTIRIFAPGTWYHVEVNVPSVDDIRAMQNNESDGRAMMMKRAAFEQEAVEEYARKGRKGSPTN